MQFEQDEKRRLWRYVTVGFLVLALGILFFFFLFRLQEIGDWIRRMRAILVPFIYGGVMAYMLRMPCNFLEKHLKKRIFRKRQKLAETVSIVASLAGVFLLLYLLVNLVAPQLFSSISSIAVMIPGAVEDASKWLEAKLADDPVLENYVLTAMEGIGQKFQAWATKDLLPMLEGMVGGFASTVSSVVAMLANLLIGMVVCIYTLASRKTFARQAKAVVYSICKPKWADAILAEVDYADRMFVGFFSGKILDSAIIGVLCYLFSLVLGFPNAMLVSVIVGVTNVIPYFGPYIGAVPSALLILMVDPVKCVWFVVFIIILQQFDGNILGPRLLAGSTGLSGFWVLFAVTVFGGLFGFVGILTGVPVFAVIYDLVRKLVVHGLKRNGKLEVLLEEAPDCGESAKKEAQGDRNSGQDKAGKKRPGRSRKGKTE